MINTASVQTFLQGTLCLLLTVALSGCTGIADISDLPAGVGGGDEQDENGSGADANADAIDDGPREDGSVDSDMPDNAYCSAVAEWDETRTGSEEEVLALVNLRRGAGADCGAKGTFAPAGALVMNGVLRCAARRHSQDMVERDFFSHINLDGESPGDRIAQAGYQALTWGENIASGHSTPQHVVDGWMSSDGHCANIMNPAFTEIGVGAYASLWTQVFGTER